MTLQHGTNMWAHSTMQVRGDPEVRDPNGYLRKSAEYKRWRLTQPAPPDTHYAPPADYSFLHNHPNNFKAIRAAFELHWAVKRLTR